MMENLYSAIKSGDSETVRKLFLENPTLASEKQRFAGISFDKSVERDAYKFLGAYLGMRV